MTVTLADIEAAAGRLAGHAVVTPLIESPALNDRAGRRVLLKPETLQRVGAFKFRGAWNRLSQMTAEERKAGVVAFSSGNHAQGVALAAKLLGMPAVIVMPSDAPAVKADATRGYGAEVITYDRLTESREAIAAKISQDRGAVVAPAFDDPDVVATPIGGGGLMSGVATAVKALSPKTALVGVEPELFDDALKSLQAGRRIVQKPTGRSLCDALESPSTGDITFPILLDKVAD